MADMLASITGMPPEEAAGFLEMAGGDVEAAKRRFEAAASGSQSPR